ncbi:MAG: LysR family transcriptional regulator [Myxococcaceae bacterium]|nr:LysR family transcriptional regulator [Myxococcaceae bacterium]
MRQLNYHHLRYFWAVARDGNMTRVAERLRVSPSALSSQVKQLEAQLDEPLFERVGRTLVLTEAGAVVFAHAETIFAAGDELLATIAEGRSPHHPLRVGASATGRVCSARPPPYRDFTKSSAASRTNESSSTPRLAALLETSASQLLQTQTPRR